MLDVVTSLLPRLVAVSPPVQPGGDATLWTDGVGRAVDSLAPTIALTTLIASVGAAVVGLCLPCGVVRCFGAGRVALQSHGTLHSHLSSLLVGVVTMVWFCGRRT